MTIQEKLVVSLNYKLSDHKTGEKIEETSTENPMVFLYGVGAIIPEFEENIYGKKVGDSFEFVIKSENAYGKADENQVAMIPLDVFHDPEGNFNPDHFPVGSLVPMSDNEGNNLRGRVVEVTPELIKMDFNHPLAGTDLHFIGEVLAIREASQDEIDHGHVHGEHGHHH